MVTRNVVLTDGQAELVEKLVTSGRYQNASEALRAGLRLLEREEAEIAALQHQLMTGIKQAEQGDFAEGTGQEAIRRIFAESARHQR